MTSAIQREAKVRCSEYKDKSCPASQMQERLAILEERMQLFQRDKENSSALKQKICLIIIEGIVLFLLSGLFALLGSVF